MVDPKDVGLGIAHRQMTDCRAVGEGGGLELHPLLVDNAATSHHHQALER